MLTSLFVAFVIGTAAPHAVPHIIEKVIAAEPDKPMLDITSTSSVANYIKEQAIKEGVDEKIVFDLVDCESDFIPQQSKHVKNGVREDSWGVWQIHLPDHPEINKQQAMDVVFSTAWSLKEIKEGRIKQWSCSK